MENYLTYLQCSSSASTFTVIGHTNNCPWIVCIPVEVNNFVSACKSDVRVKKMSKKSSIFEISQHDTKCYVKCNLRKDDTKCYARKPLSRCYLKEICSTGIHQIGIASLWLINFAYAVSSKTMFRANHGYRFWNAIIFMQL
jgi:hypothetical protein